MRGHSTSVSELHSRSCPPQLWPGLCSDYLCHLKEVRREQYSQGRITSDVPAPLEIQAVRDLVRARGKEMQLGGLMTACWAMLPEILATVGFMSVRPHSSLCALKAAFSMLQGFLYNRYPVAEKTGAGDLGTETDINENVMLVYHRVGTLQSADVVVLAGGLGPFLGPASCCPCKTFQMLAWLL